MSDASRGKNRRIMGGCALVSCALLFVGTFLVFKWFSNANQLYLDRANFAAPTGQREFIMIYKRDGMNISRLFFVRDAPPNHTSLIPLERSMEPDLVEWSADGSVVAVAITGSGKRAYEDAYDFRSHQYIHDSTGTPEKFEQRQQQIAALMEKRGGVAAPSARQNHEIGRDEQDQWRAIDPELR